MNEYQMNAMKYTLQGVTDFAKKMCDGKEGIDLLSAISKSGYAWTHAAHVAQVVLEVAAGGATVMDTLIMGVSCSSQSGETYAVEIIKQHTTGRTPNVDVEFVTDLMQAMGLDFNQALKDNGFEPL